MAIFGGLGWYASAGGEPQYTATADVILRTATIDPTITGGYDLVMAIEMVHDVPDPVAVLRTMRTLAGEDGAVLVVDERTEDSFTVPASEMERFFYTFSPLHCLAVSMQDGGAGTGTVMRAGTLREYAASAGFAAVDVLDVEHPQFRLYRLS